MDAFIEFLSLIALLLCTAVLMIFVIPYIIDRLMTASGVSEEEKYGIADYMDEFLYGDVPNNEEIKQINTELDKIKQLIETKNDSSRKSN